MPTRPATSKNRTEGSPNRTPTPKHRAPKVEKSNPTFEKSPSGFEVSTPDCPDPGVPMPDRRTARPRSRTRGPPCPGTVHAVAGCAARRVEAGRHVPRAPLPTPALPDSRRTGASRYPAVHRSGPVQYEARPQAHVCLPGSASPPACRGPASEDPANGERRTGRRHTSACRVQPHLLPAGGLLHLLPAGGRRLNGSDRQPLAPRPPDRPLCATKPAKRAHSCQVAPLVGQKKTRHLPTATRPKPDRPDNPNRPMSILSNSEPALCALAPVPSHQAAPVPRRSQGFPHRCRRARVAAATPKPARQAPRLAVFPGRNHRSGDPPPLHAFRHYPLLPTGSTASHGYSTSSTLTFSKGRV
jgi:hypothetical protein